MTHKRHSTSRGRLESCIRSNAIPKRRPSVFGIASCINAVLLCQAFLISDPPISEAQVKSASAGATGCYSIDNIIDMVKRRDRNAYPESRLISTIKTRKVCTYPTDAELDRLRRAKGTDKLIEAIEDNAPALLPPPPVEPPKPSPPPPPKLGQLIVDCSPVDCIVEVNGENIGSTTNKTLSKRLPLGKIVVSVISANYEPDRRSEIVDLKNDEDSAVTFTFHPTRSALEDAGSKLFQAMAGITGIQTLNDAPTILAKNGKLAYFDAVKKEQWRFSAQMQPPDRATYTVELPLKGRPKSFDIAHREGKFEWSKKPPKTAEVAEVNDALELLERYQLLRMVRRLKDPGFKMIAFDLNEPVADLEFKAEGGGEVYAVKLDHDHRLQEMTLESGGWDKGAVIRYSDYVEQGSFSYPKRIQVEIPSTKVGIEVEFEDIVIRQIAK